MNSRLIGYNALFLLIFFFLGGVLFDVVKYGGIKQSTSDIRKIRGSNRQAITIDPNEYSCFSIHAYYGYTNSCSPNTSHGFIKEHSLQQNRQFEKNKTFRILVLGGSVASHLTRRVSFENIFSSVSKEHSNFTERFPGGVTIFNAALGGYKQPQQAIILMTLLAEGYKFDAVVKIAGFNEIALPLSDNKGRSISPILPRSQDLREEKEIALSLQWVT